MMVMVTMMMMLQLLMMMHHTSARDTFVDQDGFQGVLCDQSTAEDR